MIADDEESDLQLHRLNLGPSSSSTTVASSILPSVTLSRSLPQSSNLHHHEYRSPSSASSSLTFSIDREEQQRQVGLGIRTVLSALILFFGGLVSSATADISV
jgi:hypothetical protein